MTNVKVIVSGATSQVGELLLPHLVKADYEVHVISRKPVDALHNESSKFVAHRFDPAIHVLKPKVEDAEILVHLAPLWVLPEIMHVLAGCGIHRLVAFGSTSRLTKQKSKSRAEQEVVRKLADAEIWLEQFCGKKGIQWTLFRPTMIYGTGRDRSITTIRNFIRRFGFFPLAGAGKGLRQPVHADDLARACIEVLGNQFTYNRTYNLGGGEVLTFRELLEAVAAREGRSVTLLRLPRVVLEVVLRIVRLFPKYRHLDSAMFARAEQDLVFDISDAAIDFSYTPRSFRKYGKIE